MPAESEWRAPGNLWADAEVTSAGTALERARCQPDSRVLLGMMSPNQGRVRVTPLDRGGAAAAGQECGSP